MQLGERCSTRELRAHVQAMVERFGNDARLCEAFGLTLVDLSKFKGGWIDVPRKLAVAFGVEFDRTRGCWTKVREATFFGMSSEDAIAESANRLTEAKKEISALKRTRCDVEARLEIERQRTEIAKLKIRLRASKARIEELEGEPA